MLAGPADDSHLRQRADGTLGLCLAELYWQDGAAEPEATLEDAIEHLNRSLAASAHALPTTERAELLEVLARCYRELAGRRGDGGARDDAERTARAALRELARCVLTADNTERALDVAAKANQLVASTVSWCLADNRHRAALEMSEAGRGLVLASVVLTGRVEQLLRDAGRPDAADAWRDGDEAGRLAGLDALWDTGQGGTLLTAPTAQQIAMMLGSTRFDALVYLVPSEPSGRAETGNDSLPGHAVILRPILGQIDVLELPNLAEPAGTPLDAYLTALSGALEAVDPAMTYTDGFRGTPNGQAWADALDELGSWAHARIVGPLIEHVRGWSLDRTPHLALIPLGQLAAIPYAAAWVEDPAQPGGRRYAIDDLILTHTISARLLTEVTRRPRQQLTERVVLMAHRAFPLAWRTARALASRQYPRAEVYARKSDRNGLATTAALLAALPGRSEPGASLLQLSTHAATAPVPQLQTADGWLPISRILDHARNRPPDSPGGLVITSACLTDSTQTHYDESLTLATALLAAGATAVIGTRWPIESGPAAVLTTRLHYHLQGGLSVADALRRAQLDLLRPEADTRTGLDRALTGVEDDQLRHPASWAGYVHQGI